MTKTSITLQELRRRIYIKAKAEQTHRFWGLHVHVYKMETLLTGYQAAKVNKGAPGIDGVTFEQIEHSGVMPFLLQLQDELRTENYRPQRNRMVEIPKAGQPNKVRKLGIPCIRDRVVQNALRLILEPVFEADFQDGSHGYRPKKTSKGAIERVMHAIGWEKTRVIDLDLKSYFDTVRHHILLAKIAKRVDDDRILHLLKIILKAGGKMGVPQGGTLSPLLSNIYLNEVDKMLEKAKCTSMQNGYPTMEYARFADDLVVLVGWHYTHDWLWKGIDKRLREELAKLQVGINEEKTKYVHLNRRNQQFSFLGFRFFRKKSLKTGKNMPLCIPKIEARTKLIAQLREVFKRKISRPIAEVVKVINPILRGWLNYFRMGNASHTFKYVKRWVIEKVRRHLMRAKGRRGFGWKRWNDKELLAMHKVYSDYSVPSRRPNPYRQAILF